MAARASLPSLGFRLPLAQDFLGRLDRTNHYVQANEDQVDVGYRDRDLSSDYQAAIEYVIECFEQGDVCVLPFFADDYLIER